MQHSTSLGTVLSARHLPALDGLRAVAVALVIIYHAGYEIPGDLGVTGFFVLSGFLITWLLLREHEKSGTVSLRGFYMRRTLRIFPAYYAFVAFSVLTDTMLGHAWTAGQLQTALTYTVNYYNAASGHTGPVAHAWSLAVEEQFYLLWPALYLVLMRRGTGALRTGLLVLIGGVLLWRSALFVSGTVGPAYAYNALDTRFDSLAVGCLLAVLLRHAVTLREGELLAGRAWYPLVTAGLIVWSRVGGSEAYHYAVGFTVDSLLIAVLIVQLLQVHAAPGWRWLDHRVTRYVGALSYPLYLWHLVGLGIGAKLAFLPPVGQDVAGAAVAVVLAAGSYHLLEQPVLKLMPRVEAWLARKPRPGAAPGAVESLQA
jgi:peptidoglycan/LPS O-acetylase OafA/YrhL